MTRGQWRKGRSTRAGKLAIARKHRRPPNSRRERHRMRVRVGGAAARKPGERTRTSPGRRGRIHPDWLAPDGSLALSDADLAAIADAINPTGSTYGNCAALAEHGMEILSRPRSRLVDGDLLQPFPGYTRSGSPAVPDRGEGTFAERFASTSDMIRQRLAPGGVAVLGTSALEGAVGRNTDHAVTLYVDANGEVGIVDFQRKRHVRGAKRVEKMFPRDSHYTTDYGVPIYPSTLLRVWSEASTRE